MSLNDVAYQNTPPPHHLLLLQHPLCHISDPPVATPVENTMEQNTGDKLLRNFYRLRQREAVKWKNSELKGAAANLKIQVGRRDSSGVLDSNRQGRRIGGWGGRKSNFKALIMKHNVVSLCRRVPCGGTGAPQLPTGLQLWFLQRMQQRNQPWTQVLLVLGPLGSPYSSQGPNVAL